MRGCAEEFIWKIVPLIVENPTTHLSRKSDKTFLASGPARGCPWWCFVTKFWPLILLLIVFVGDVHVQVQWLALYLYLYMTCICIWGDPCQGVPHTLGLFVRVGCHKGAATTEEAENLSFNPSFIVFKCLDSHHSFIGLFVGAVKCVTCFSCPQSPSHWLLNCAHTRSQSRCKHLPLYTLLKVAQNGTGKT